MAFCTKCGKQNAPTAKYCTGCGEELVTKTDQLVQPALIAKKKSTANKKLNIGVIVSLSLLAVAAGVYFIFFYKSKKPEEKNVIANTEKAAIPPPADTTAVYEQPPKTVSEAVPLNPQIQDSQSSITQTEVDNVSQILKKFYQCENDEDISCLLDHYDYPLSRYYQLYNVSYEDLHKLFTESFNEKLSYHFIAIKWEYSTVQKSGDGYKAVLYADYNFVRQKEPGENRSRSIQVIIFMNSNYMITDIYEN